MLNRLGRLLPESHELNKALGLGAVLFSITSSYTLVKIARDALFLSRLPASALPLVYLIVGVLTLAVTVVFGVVMQRFSPLRTLLTTTTVAAVTLIAFGASFELQHPWLPFAFYVWVNVYGLVLVSQFWAFTNSRSDPREAKRIFGIVGGGGILGGLVAGWVAAGFGQRVSLSWLAFGGAAVLGAMVIVLLLAVRHGRVETSEDQAEEEPRASAPLLRVSYVRWLALATLCSVVVTGVLDFQFKVVAQALHPDAPGLAAFFGRFFIAMNTAALLLQLLGTRWLLQRLGAGPAAAVLPAGLMAGSIATLLAPGAWTVLGTRLWDQVLRFSLNKSTTELFYFPMDPNLRRRAKAFIEAGIERFGDALAGLLILGAILFLDTRPITLSAVVAVLVAVWLVAWFKLKNGYVRELGRSLRRMSLGEGRVSLRERDVLKQLARALESRHEPMALQALEMLAEHAPPLIEARLPGLLQHASPRVRSRALELAGTNPPNEAREAIERLIYDPDPGVRLKALRARCAFGEAGSLAGLEEFLDTPDPGLRATALHCLVEYASDADLPRVRAKIEERLGSDTALDRVIAAEAIGARPAPSVLQTLLPPLLHDPDPAVRQAALRSAGRAGLREQLPDMIEALGVRETEAAARSALQSMGASVIGTLGERLVDPGVDIAIRRAIPRVLREFATSESVDALLRVRGPEDVQLQFRILKALNRIRMANPEHTFPAERVEEDIDLDVRHCLTAELHGQAWERPSDPAETFLARVVRERRVQALDRVFRRLALIYPAAAMFAAYQGLLSANARVRGSAVEYVESALSVEQRALVVPLLPDAPAEPRAELARERYGLEPFAAGDSLGLLLESDDAWLRTCALYVAGRHRERRLLDGIERGLGAVDERVRETAGWAKLALSRA